MTSIKDKGLLTGWLGLMVWLVTGVAVQGQQWVDDSFKDFSKGLLDASGQNLYISKDGKVRAIHRFDYNEDGHIDLLFCQTHDVDFTVPATLLSLNKNRELQTSEFPVKGSLQTTAADLNKDGFTDIIFCPNSYMGQAPRRFLTILYGNESGWSMQRSFSGLSVHGMQSVLTADLNRDGWKDIVVLNNKKWTADQPDGNILRIFWGSPRGYENRNFLDFGVPKAIKIASGDLDKDGYEDLAVLRSDSSLLIYPSTSAFTSPEHPGKPVEIQLPLNPASLAIGDTDNDGIAELVVGSLENEIVFLKISSSGNWKVSTSLKGVSASEIIIGDIDQDGENDLLVSEFRPLESPKTGPEAAHILWGQKGLPFSISRSAALAADHLSSAVFGDFDADGKNDVVISVNRSEGKYEAESLIYFGMGNRAFEKGKQGVPTIGAVHVSAVRLRPEEPLKAFFANNVTGEPEEKVPAYLYWGSRGGFNMDHREEIPMRSAYEATSADFNADGYPDLAIMDAMHGGQELTDDLWAGANLFYGSANGFDFNKRVVLSEANLGSSNTADLNKDGYLDLVLGKFENAEILIYYGGSGGFSKDNMARIPCKGRSLGIQLADYDKDGWLDIAVNSYGQMGIRIFFGTPGGFDENRKFELEGKDIIDLETADLNRDGWLDILACSYSDVANNAHHDMGMTIYWGSPGGFNHANAQWLPAYTPLGPVIADFDRDGHLDIFAPAYHTDLTREEIPSMLYWGSTEGFSTDNRTSLINDSGADGLAADFDGDGLLDLAVANHSRNGNHNTLSRVFYNDGQRFKTPRIETIPTKGPHWSLNEDMGHIYDRSWTQWFHSGKFTWPRQRSRGEIKYLAGIPEGTKIRAMIRSAPDTGQIEKQYWRETDAEGHFSLLPGDRCIQYQILFISDNGDRYPVLDQVKLSLY